MVVGLGMWTKLCGLWLICVFQLIVWLAALWLHSLDVLPWPSHLKMYVLPLPFPDASAIISYCAILNCADYLGKISLCPRPKECTLKRSHY